MCIVITILMLCFFINNSFFILCQSILHILNNNKFEKIDALFNNKLF